MPAPQHTGPPACAGSPAAAEMCPLPEAPSRYSEAAQRCHHASVFSCSKAHLGCSSTPKKGKNFCPLIFKIQFIAVMRLTEQPANYCCDINGCGNKV